MTDQHCHLPALTGIARERYGSDTAHGLREENECNIVWSELTPRRMYHYSGDHVVTPAEPNAPDAPALETACDMCRGDQPPRMDEGSVAKSPK
jgi:hypothetical protein